MINFRYHIVSLMAVFLALSVGIVLGVTLRGPVNQGLAQQAAQDRRTVQELRGDLDQRRALDDYRDSYAQQVGAEVTRGVLAGRSVAVVVMPGAPGAVVSAVSKAVTAAGGTLIRTVRISRDVFDPATAAAVGKAVAPYRASLRAGDRVSNARVTGLALGRSVFARQAGQRDSEATGIARGLTTANLVSLGGNTDAQAELAIVVTDEATDPPVTAEALRAHVDLEVALKEYAAGVVLAGPNSDNVDGTDVATARGDANADTVSTVDVADLPSGVSTTILACKEQWLGRAGHYGALANAAAPVPDLPVR